MAKINIKQVDAFTTTPHTGNPAGVVLDAKGLTEQQMQSIAREMNLSETAFVLPASRSGADLKIRWFTPTAEASLCGHAMIASFHVLAEERLFGMDKPGNYTFRLESVAGILPIEVTKEERSTSIMLGLKIPSFERVIHYKIDLLRIIDIALSDFDNRMPLLRSDYLFIPVKRLHNLFTLKPHFLAMANFLLSRKLKGICVFTTETVDRDSLVHTRCFAPHAGINEDPVTGTVYGPLAVQLFDCGLLKIDNGQCTFQGEQGDVMGRRGRVRVELFVDENKPSSVRIGGNAVTVMEGEMLLRD